MALLEHCERKYFLNYYTFALKQDYPDLWSETLLLKWLKNVEMWIWEKSHFLLSDYLHVLKKWEVTEEKIEELKNNMRIEMKADFGSLPEISSVKELQVPQSGHFPKYPADS